MNLDSGFFFALLRDHDPLPFNEVDRDWFEGTWGQVYDYVSGLLRDGGVRALPTPELIESEFNVLFERTDDKIEIFISGLRKRKATLVLENAILTEFSPGLMKVARDQDPLAVAEAMMRLAVEVKRKYRPRSQIDYMDFTHDTLDRWNDYQERKAKLGQMGIPYPFDPLNQATGGLIAGEVTVFLGRPGSGKTWFLNLCAIHALNKGYSVAYFSQEMRPRRNAIRVDALLAGVSPKRFWRGDTTEEEDARILSVYHAMAKWENSCFVYGPSAIPSLAHFEGQLSSLCNKVDLIIWDCPYLCMRSEKWEERYSFVRHLKLLMEDYDLPLLATWQLNDDDRPAYAKAIEQDLDHNFILSRNRQDKETDRTCIKSVKTRDGLELDKLVLHWDLRTGNFGVLSWSIQNMGSSDHRYAVSFDYRNRLERYKNDAGTVGTLGQDVGGQ